MESLISYKTPWCIEQAGDVGGAECSSRVFGQQWAAAGHGGTGNVGGTCQNAG